MKNYNTSPLPFQGQKRKFVKHFKEVLAHFPSNATYIDLFGGSGLLSHIVKALNTMPQYVYFGSNKGQLLDLFDFLANEYDLPSPFNDTERISVSTSVNYASIYEDLMIYKTSKQ